MSAEFEMRMVRELNLFLGLQIKQPANGIFYSQTTPLWLKMLD